MKPKADDKELAAFLALRLQVERVALRRLDRDCVSRAYLANAEGRMLFVKWGENDGSRANAFLGAVENPFLIKPLAGFPCLCCGLWVHVFDWRVFTRLNLEDMSDMQFQSFWRKYLELFALLQQTPSVAVSAPRDGSVLRNELLRYVKRVPLARWVLRSLVSLVDEDCVFSSQTPRVVVHGDFHCGNCGFCGDELSVFLDFDLLAYGAQVEDLVFMVAERVKRFRRGDRALGGVWMRFRQMVKLSGRPTAEWRIAVNAFRLYSAVRLIERHPNQLRAAFNAWRRDCRLQLMLRELASL